MSYLLESTLTNNSDKEFYGRRLSKEEREGLLYRGTEYDIEFLYRVLNGDPIAGTFLLDQTNYKGVTSDFGYTTATPCWLHLNNNMRYFGSVASLSVSHALFTENMVPMLSIVQISFSRYPALWNINSENTLASLKDQIKTNASGSSTTADTTGTGGTK
jgi:hypothetical protein